MSSEGFLSLLSSSEVHTAACCSKNCSSISKELFLRVITTCLSLCSGIPSTLCFSFKTEVPVVLRWKNDTIRPTLPKRCVASAHFSPFCRQVNDMRKVLNVRWQICLFLSYCLVAGIINYKCRFFCQVYATLHMLLSRLYPDLPRSDSFRTLSAVLLHLPVSDDRSQLHKLRLYRMSISCDCDSFCIS